MLISNFIIRIKIFIYTNIPGIIFLLFHNHLKNFQFVFADKIVSVLFALLFDLKIFFISFFQGIITR